jgi:hypothetical protein
VREDQRGNPTQTQMSNKSSAHNVEVNFFRWRRDDGLLCSGCCAVALPFATLPLLVSFLIRSAIFLIMPFPLFPLCPLCPLCPLLMVATFGNFPHGSDTLFRRNGFPGDIICNCRVRNVQSCMNDRVEGIGLRMRCNVMCFESCCLQFELSVLSSVPSTLPVPSLRTSDLL